MPTPSCMERSTNTFTCIYPAFLTEKSWSLSTIDSQTSSRSTQPEFEGAISPSPTNQILRIMKKDIIELLGVLAIAMTLVGCGVYAQRLEDDKAQLKEDVRRLMDTIDDEGDTDKYLCGPDYVERLWKWSHDQ